MNHQPYNIKNEKVILDKISQLQPLNYNQFRWWRRFEQPNKLLPNNSSLLDKINNGDLEFSHFYWQAKYMEMQLNQAYQESHDSHHWVESNRMDRARRKRLWEDFEKDEFKKLEYIRKEFLREFFIEGDEYDLEIVSFDGTLKELYSHCESKYGKQLRSKKRRGRPSKY
jgi:hypothetical protein